MSTATAGSSCITISTSVHHCSIKIGPSRSCLLLISLFLLDHCHHTSSFAIVSHSTSLHNNPLPLKMQSDNNNKNNNIKGTINIAVTVDGFIAGKDGNIDWLNNQPKAEEGEGDFGFGDFLNSIDVMVMGRNTYETIVSFGPDMWAYGNDLPILVWTSTNNAEQVQRTMPDWIQEKQSKGLIQIKSSSSAQELWKELQQTSTKRKHKSENQQQQQQPIMVYVDGGKTIQSFLKAGLIHRMNLTRIPILLGEGIPLFANGSDDDNNNNASTIQPKVLKHISTKSYSNGFVTSVYDVIVDDDDDQSS